MKSIEQLLTFLDETEAESLDSQDSTDCPIIYQEECVIQDTLYLVRMFVKGKSRKLMTLSEAIQQDQPFTSDEMLNGHSARFLMFIEGKILYFDNDRDCDDWINIYKINFNSYSKKEGEIYYLY